MKNFIKCVLLFCLNNGVCFSASSFQGFPRHFFSGYSHERVNSDLMLVQDEHTSVYTRADIAANILSYPELAEHHETILPVAIALAQNERLSPDTRYRLSALLLERGQVHVNTRAHCALTILGRTYFAEHHRTIFNEYAVINFAVELALSEQLEFNTKANLVDKTLRSRVFSVRDETVFLMAIEFAQSERVEFDTRADIAAAILRLPVLVVHNENIVPRALAIHHETIAPVAIALVQHARVDVNKRAKLAYNILGRSALAVHHETIAQAAVELVLHEALDDRRRASLARAILACAKFAAYDETIAPVAIKLVKNENICDDIRALLALTILDRTDLPVHHETIAPVAIALAQGENICDDIGACIASTILDYSALAAFHATIAPRAVAFAEDDANALLEDDIRVSLADAILRRAALDEYHQRTRAVLESLQGQDDEASSEDDESGQIQNPAYIARHVYMPVNPEAPLINQHLAPPVLPLEEFMQAVFSSADADLYIANGHAWTIANSGAFAAFMQGGGSRWSNDPLHPNNIDEGAEGSITVTYRVRKRNNEEFDLILTRKPAQATAETQAETEEIPGKRQKR